MKSTLRVVIASAVFVFVASMASGATAQELVTKQARNSPSFLLFQGDGRNFLLRDSLRYEIKRTKQIVIVPGGFVTDFASVPRWAQWVISILGRHSVPAIVHDFLYWEQKCTREQADLILADAMEEYHSNWFQMKIVYWAVRIGAGGNWSTNASDRKQGLLKIVPANNADVPPNTDWYDYRKKLFDDGVKEEPFESNPAACSLTTTS